MTNIKLSVLCTGVTLRKWIGNKRIYSVAAVIIVFCFYTFWCLRQYASIVEMPVTPWVFPFFLSFPVMVMVYGCMAALLFCNAPFTDNQMPFLIIRTGRRNFMIGQLFYIVIAAFFFNLLIAIASGLALAPNIVLSSDWGIVLKSFANDPQSALGTSSLVITVAIAPAVLDYFTPVTAMLTAFLLMWLVTIFIGMVILFFNVVVGKLSGLIAIGVLIFFSYFSFYLGNLLFGGITYFFSPLSWCNIYALDFISDGKSIPSPGYAVLVLSTLIIIMGTVSVIAFSKKDMDYQEWRD